MSSRASWRDKSPATVTIDSDAVFTTVATIPIREGSSNLWFDFDLRGTAGDGALTAFNTDVRAHEDSNWHTVANATSDYTTNITAPIKGVSNNPVVLAKGTASLIWMECKGLESVRFRAKSGASDAIVSDYYWQVR